LGTEFSDKSILQLFSALSDQNDLNQGDEAEGDDGEQSKRELRSVRGLRDLLLDVVSLVEDQSIVIVSQSLCNGVLHQFAENFGVGLGQDLIFSQRREEKSNIGAISSHLVDVWGAHDVVQDVGFKGSGVNVKVQEGQDFDDLVGAVGSDDERNVEQLILGVQCQERGHHA